MWNPGIDRTNRKARRNAMKYNNADDKDTQNNWQLLKDFYRPRTAPIDLGIKQYKREHSNEPKRVLYFKQEMWNAFHELKGESHGH